LSEAYKDFAAYCLFAEQCVILLSRESFIKEAKYLFPFLYQTVNIIGRILMKPKKVCFSELAYFIGIIALALGTALMERADFGMSMVVAPAYLLHLKISPFFPPFTFGMAEYCLQAFLIIMLCLVLRKFKLSYLFSFVTAVFYGLALDLMIYIVGFIPWEGIAARLFFFVSGMLLGSCGVAFVFHTYIAPEAYELFVKEISAKYGFKIERVKTAYDFTSCIISIALSFIFFGFGHFEAIKVGTIVCAALNGWTIGQINKLLGRAFIFKDAFKLHSIFDK